jgi:hypothetical protein
VLGLPVDGIFGGSGLHNPVKQRKSGSNKIWEKVAHHFKMTCEELLSLGRTILEEVEAPVDQSMKRDTGFAQDVPIAPLDKIKKYDIPEVSEKAISDIPEKIVKTI